MNNVARARENRRRATESERKLWARLRGRQVDGHKFRRQHPLGEFIVDFICLRQQLVIEVDGPVHERQHDADQKKDDWVERQGFGVLRFTDEEVMARTDDVVQTIRANCRRGV